MPIITVIRISIISSPQKLKVAFVSKIESPVTQVAEVAVKRASIKEIPL